jgi:hypothetical protein
MAGVPLPFALAGGLLGAGLSQVMKPPKPVAGPPPVTRNMAAEAARESDALRRRRGAGANELVGRGAGEARSPGGKVLLGQ